MLGQTDFYLIYSRMICNFKTFLNLKLIIVFKCFIINKTFWKKSIVFPWKNKLIKIHFIFFSKFLKNLVFKDWPLCPGLLPEEFELCPGKFNYWICNWNIRMNLTSLYHSNNNNMFFIVTFIKFYLLYYLIILLSYYYSTLMKKYFTKKYHKYLSKEN